ncbi:MAG: hypothetical protein LBH13_06620 [Cellulomonadaceae bacterium]|jgi:hypothetical protein|nr:hypothetical protein [Cellulomonadaceae bacterium]
MMPLLADGRIRCDIATVAPHGFNTGCGLLPLKAGSLILINGGHKQLARAGYRLPIDDIPDPAPVGVIPPRRTLSAEIEAYWEGEKPGAATVAGILGQSGTRAWLLERTGPKAVIPLRPGDEGMVYAVVSRQSQPPADRRAGYCKSRIPLIVLNLRPFTITP